MPEAIIPGSSIERIYPTENDVGNQTYIGVRGTENNMAKLAGLVKRNGILSNRDGLGISLGEGGFALTVYSGASLQVTFNLGVAAINGYYINCVAANTVNIVLDASQINYVYLKLVKVGGIVGDELAAPGALKIVSSFTPTALDDYIPLWMIVTDGVGVNSVVDIRPRALGIPTPIKLNIGSGGFPKIVYAAILPTGFDAFNVLSGVIFADGDNPIGAGAVGIKAENGTGTINSESNVLPPIPVPLPGDLYQVRLKIPTTFKPNSAGLYEIRPFGLGAGPGNYLVTTVWERDANGSIFAPPYDLRPTWMLADW